MFCINCGTELPDEANFCWKCGTPQKADIQVEELKWEICEILSEEVGQHQLHYPDYKFWAKAIGPKGIYSAGASRKFEGGFYGPDAGKKSNTARLESLIARLIREGWEPTGDRGPKWFNHRFRRHVRP